MQGSKKGLGEKTKTNTTKAEQNSKKGWAKTEEINALTQPSRSTKKMGKNALASDISSGSKIDGGGGQRHLRHRHLGLKNSGAKSSRQSRLKNSGAKSSYLASFISWLSATHPSPSFIRAATFISIPLLAILVSNLLFNTTLDYVLYDTQIADKRSGQLSAFITLYSSSYIYVAIYLALGALMLLLPEWLRRAYRALIYLASALLILLSILEVYTLIRFGLMIELSLASIILTELGKHKESMEFLSVHLASALLIIASILAVMSALFYLARRPFDRLVGALYVPRYLGLFILSYIVLALLSIAGLRYLRAPMFAGNTIFYRLIKTTRGIEHLIKMSESFKASPPQPYKGARLTSLAKSTPKYSVVFILGESSDRNHFSLYGYRLDTTPHLRALEKSGALIFYTDVISPEIHTMNVLPQLLTEANLANKASFTTVPNIIDTLNALGYHTYWLSNQENMRLYSGYNENIATYSAIYIRSSVYASSIEHSYKGYANYDLNMLPFISRLGFKEGRRNFIVLHTYGQHVKYAARFSDEFARFGIKDYANRSDLSKNDKQIISEYDNAALYVDNYINEIYEMFKDTDTLIVYLSDHGENVYDELSYHKGRALPYDRYELEVPLLFIATPSFRRLHAKKWAQIGASRHHSAISDNFNYALLDAAGVSYEGFPYYLDILSDRYKQPNSRCLANGYCYKGHANQPQIP